MGGIGAMQVCGIPRKLDGCTERESELCRAFALPFVKHAAGVLTSLKPAALFSFIYSTAISNSFSMTRPEFWKIFRTYRKELGQLGISVVAFPGRDDRSTMLVYRLELIDQLLRDNDIRAFLEVQGYDVSSGKNLVAQFCRQLIAFYSAARKRAEYAEGSTTANDSYRNAPFPHAIGILFGYPLEDVIGFMNGEEETCHGPWRAYGDERVARERFARFSRVRKTCLMRYELGCSLGELCTTSVSETSDNECIERWTRAASA